MVGEHLARHLQVPPTLDAIAKVPHEKLLQAQMALSAEVFTAPDPSRWGEVAANLMPFEPVIDGDVLPALPIEQIRAGSGSNVDLLVGTNSDEERLFIVPNGLIDAIDESVLAATAAGSSEAASARPTRWRFHSSSTTSIGETTWPCSARAHLRASPARCTEPG